MVGRVPNSRVPNSGAKYIVNGADPSLPNAQDISGITGLVKSAAGSLSAAVAGTDYQIADVRSYWATYLAKKLGVTPDQIFGYFQDFDGGVSGRTNPGGTNTVNAKPALDGGWESITVGNGTNAGNYGFLGAATPGAGAPSYLANPKTSKWLMVMRGKVTTTPGANTKWTIGVNATTLNAGIIAATSSTKYVCVYGATTLTSGISIDTGTHVIVIWYDGTTVHFWVDSEADDHTGANTNLPTAQNEIQQSLSTNAGEAAQTENIDYFGIFTARS